MNATAALAILALAGSCAAGGDRCSSPSDGSVNAFFPGREPSRDIIATVASITPLEELGGFRYDMTTGERLTWIANVPIAGVAAGGTYRFVVDYRPGFPDAAGILVYERDELFFAALTDQKPLQLVLREGVPGFDIALGETTCKSRENSRCHEAIVNLPVTFEHAGSRATVFQRETARLGDFDVRVLTAQSVKYSSRCADAGLPGVSFVIARAK